MLDLADLRLFRALGHARSLAAAARLLDVTPPALTARLKALEATLGVQLAVRTARGVSLTDEGRRLHDEASDLLARLDALPDRIAADAGSIAGHVRIVAPFGFGRVHVAPLLRQLHRQHPALSLSLTLAAHPLGQAGGQDIVVHIGTLKDCSWIAHRLAANRRILCASPAFLRRLPSPPSEPAHLRDLPCLCIEENDEPIRQWRFTPAADSLAPGKRAVTTVPVSGPLTANEGTVITQWAVQGLGIIARSEWEVAPLLRRGTLVPLLPAWQLEPAPILALTPARQGLPARVREVIRRAQEAWADPPWQH